jgi:N-dimethylarginine dimethylaminohydrolase
MEIPWGDINRFQRLSGDINLDYDDLLLVCLSAASSLWGCTRLQKCLSRKVKEKVW